MSKERLELAKELLDSFKSNREIHEPFVMSFEYETIEALEYIIEQVERVEDLEETIEDYKKINKDRHRRVSELRKQNKRYREYFNKIIETDERLVDKQYFKDIAEQAIKEE